MNKKEYIDELEKALRAAHVQDSDDIIEEYAVHFDMKLQDGYSAEEVAARLASPKDIANQFASIKSGDVTRNGGKAVLTAGMIFTDIFAGSFFILLYAWVIVLISFTIVSAGVGISAIIKNTLYGIIPEMPYFCALLIGVSMIVMAVLSAIGTEYCRLYVTQLIRVYIRWRKNVTGDGRNALPPLTMRPPIKARKRRNMRNIALFSIALFAVCFIAGLGSMMIAAGSLEPWHVWRWFM